MRQKSGFNAELRIAFGSVGDPNKEGGFVGATGPCEVDALAPRRGDGEVWAAEVRSKEGLKDGLNAMCGV